VDFYDKSGRIILNSFRLDWADYLEKKGRS